MNQLATLLWKQVLETLVLRDAFSAGDISIDELIYAISSQRKSRVQMFDDIASRMPGRPDVQLQRERLTNFIDGPEFSRRWKAMFGITVLDSEREGLLDKVYAAIGDVEEGRSTNKGCYNTLITGVRLALDDVARHAEQYRVDE